jgi:hypothetical protein
VAIAKALTAAALRRPALLHLHPLTLLVLLHHPSALLPHLHPLTLLVLLHHPSALLHHLHSLTLLVLHHLLALPLSALLHLLLVLQLLVLPHHLLALPHLLLAFLGLTLVGPPRRRRKRARWTSRLRPALLHTFALPHLLLALPLLALPHHLLTLLHLLLALLGLALVGPLRRCCKRVRGTPRPRPALLHTYALLHLLLALRLLALPHHLLALPHLLLALLGLARVGPLRRCCERVCETLRRRPALLDPACVQSLLRLTWRLIGPLLWSPLLIWTLRRRGQAVRDASGRRAWRRPQHVC